MTLKQRLLSQSAVIFATRVFGAGMIFLAQAAIARSWGAALLGDYLLVIATVNLLAMVMPLGFQTIGTYFVAQYGATDDRRMLFAFLIRCYGHILAAGLLVLVLCRPVAQLVGGAGTLIAELALPTSLIAISTAAIFTNCALLVGLRRPFVGFFAETIFRPLLLIGAFAAATALVTGDARLEAMLWLFAGGYLFVAFVQFLLVIDGARRIPASVDARKPDVRRWWRFAVPWVAITVATEFYFDIDLLLLSGHLERTELAVFGICVRIFSLISFGVAAVYAVIVPDMFEADARNDRAGFHQRIGEANLVAGAIAIVLLAGVVIFGRIALSIFGPHFETGAWPLVILCLGLVVRALFGPATIVLSIHDRPYASLPAVGVGLASLVAFNHLLVPAMGLLGAALAALLAITIWTAGLWLTAYTIVGVDVSIVARLRSMRGEGSRKAPLPGA